MLWYLTPETTKLSKTNTTDMANLVSQFAVFCCAAVTGLFSRGRNKKEVSEDGSPREQGPPGAGAEANTEEAFEATFTSPRGLQLLLAGEPGDVISNTPAINTGNPGDSPDMPSSPLPVPVRSRASTPSQDDAPANTAQVNTNGPVQASTNTQGYENMYWYYSLSFARSPVSPEPAAAAATEKDIPVINSLPDIAPFRTTYERARCSSTVAISTPYYKPAQLVHDYPSALTDTSSMTFGPQPTNTVQNPQAAVVEEYCNALDCCSSKAQRIAVRDHCMPFLVMLPWHVAAAARRFDVAELREWCFRANLPCIHAASALEHYVEL